MNFKNSIAIIGAGCVLPGARNTDEFWKILCEGKSQFCSLPEERWPKNVYFDPENKQGDSTYSDLASFVADDLFFYSQSSLPRGHQMMLKALKEAVAPLPLDEIRKKRVAVVLGCMNPEEGAAVSLVKAQEKSLIEELKYKKVLSANELTTFEQEFNKWFPKSSESKDIHFPSSLAFYIHRELGTKGLAFCADSACGSSLTAIDLACLLLESREVDLVITGGVEANLGIETYIPFSRLGVLAQKKSLPYDSRSEGIVQGEGAVLFVLERLSDTQKKEKEIWGLIEGIASSSNGSSSSLFSPSKESQKANFVELEKVATDHPIYIEGHGTGTIAGDQSELEALSEVFQKKVFLGSVKAIIGHTKGAAGAAGLLKCLLSIRHSYIPPSAYFENSCLKTGMGNVIINSKGKNIKKNEEPIQMRVCSAGFGGANYYLSLKEYKDQPPLGEEAISSSGDPVIIAFSQVPFFDEIPSCRYHEWKIPPNLAEHLDFAQLGALRAFDLALEKSLISKELLQKHKTCMISASHTRTEKIEKLNRALQFKKIEGQDFAFQKKLKEYRNGLVKLDETSCQALNSMVSGRVANAFDLKGTNFHIDADFSSLGYSLKMGRLMLEHQRAEMVIVLGIEETPEELPFLISRKSVSCWVITSQEIATKETLPQLGSLGEVLISHER
ncbi:MAG: hypothetical protein EBQ92_03895 [Proteobacteria bacterium]|nr:hypothetical protein [Pseudomonadota bacterium]